MYANCMLLLPMNRATVCVFLSVISMYIHRFSVACSQHLWTWYFSKRPWVTFDRNLFFKEKNVKRECDNNITIHAYTQPTVRRQFNYLCRDCWSCTRLLLGSSNIIFRDRYKPVNKHGMLVLHFNVRGVLSSLARHTSHVRNFRLLCWINYT